MPLKEPSNTKKTRWSCRSRLTRVASHHSRRFRHDPTSCRHHPQPTHPTLCDFSAHNDVVDAILLYQRGIFIFDAVKGYCQIQYLDFSNDIFDIFISACHRRRAFAVDMLYVVLEPL